MCYVLIDLVNIPLRIFKDALQRMSLKIFFPNILESQNYVFKIWSNIWLKSKLEEK